MQSDNVPIVFEIFVNAKDVKQVWEEGEKEEEEKKLRSRRVFRELYEKYNCIFVLCSSYYIQSGIVRV